MALLSASNTLTCSVAFECEVGDVVLRQGTLVTSPVPYCYGKFLCAVVSYAHRCTHFLYSFLIFFPGE